MCGKWAHYLQPQIIKESKPKERQVWISKAARRKSKTKTESHSLARKRPYPDTSCRYVCADIVKRPVKSRDTQTPSSPRVIAVRLRRRKFTFFAAALNASLWVMSGLPALMRWISSLLRHYSTQPRLLARRRIC
jgi:hypothetical protein